MSEQGPQMGYYEHYTRLLGTGMISGQEAIFFCPFEGCIGYQQRKFYVNMYSGCWSCKHCNQSVPGRSYKGASHGGGWRDFIRLWNLAHPDKPESQSQWLEVPQGTFTPAPRKLPDDQVKDLWTRLINSMSLLERDADLIEKRGIDPVKAGMVSVRRTDWNLALSIFGPERMREAGLARIEGRYTHPTLCVEQGRILLPTRSNQGVEYFIGYQPCPPRSRGQSEESYQRFRSFWVKYPGPVGFSSAVYGEVPFDCPLLIITEGQLKALSAIQRGFPAVGLPGIGSCHEHVSTLCVERRVKRAVIIFDTQAKDQENVDQQAYLLSKRLLQKGVPTFRARLPLDPDIEEGKKTDLDAYLLRHESAGLWMILKGSERLITQDEQATLPSPARSSEPPVRPTAYSCYSRIREDHRNYAPSR